jgi:predicted transcriptional regulator
MGHDAIKLELIEWLSKLEDDETINYLKVVKDSINVDNDWWDDLSMEQKNGIERGLKDVDEGRVVAHEDVKMKYGL